MSKIGKRPVTVPTGVTATVQGQQIKMKGPKGELSMTLTDEVGAKLDKGEITIEKKGDTKRHDAVWGMTRSMIANLVEGVTKGY
jgi:large subunit ribosomal protein L6